MIAFGATSVHVGDTGEFDEPELGAVVRRLEASFAAIARVVAVVCGPTAANTHSPVDAGCVTDNSCGL